MTTLPETLSEAAVAALLGITVRTLRNKRTLGDGPTIVKLSRKAIVYLPEDVAAYVQARRVVPGVTPPAPVPTKAPEMSGAPKRKPGRPKGSYTRRNRGGED